jgi:hypothetical protein
MDNTELRAEFEKQFADYDLKIRRGEEELVKLREYRTKLEGGLEALNILEKGTDGSDTSQHTD